LEGRLTRRSESTRGVEVGQNQRWSMAVGVDVEDVRQRWRKGRAGAVDRDATGATEAEEQRLQLEVEAAMTEASLGRNKRC
jgi:hypothetical protein